MENNESYSETTDQPAFTELTLISNWFDKCYRDIVRLLEELQKANDSTNE